MTRPNIRRQKNPMTMINRERELRFPLLTSEMEDIQMKETIFEKHPEFDPETYKDPILEECYRIQHD